MSEVTSLEAEQFTTAEAQKYIESKVSIVYRPFALKALDATSVAEVDQIGLAMSGGQASTGFILGTGAPGEVQGKFWTQVLSEVHEYFCTNSRSYVRERTQAVGVFEHAVTVISTALAGTVSIGIALITGIVSVAVLSIAKIGRNAWCKWCQDNLILKKVL